VTVVDLPPAASCATAEIPDCKKELEDNWEVSVQSVWAKLATTQVPTRADWEVLIRAERLNRMSWIEAEESGVKKRGKKALMDLMGSKVDENGNLVKVIEKKVKAVKVPKEPKPKKLTKKELALQAAAALLAANPSEPDAECPF